MKIRGIKDGIEITTPSGFAMTAGLVPVDVPKEYESEVRAALPHVFGIEEVDKPAKPRPAAESPEKKAEG